ncbi:DUF6074 family protein [Rhizobium sp. Root1220]|uniref:DUF6074 family protein n=1 Tax=Rhizobium sp. Root1220 TaxID=1736432 RepID=UPI0007021E16|nr:DUF6074 family protein [Rhizobium sp. Root1220]KQV72997.1 hypothetical protein ASC90_06170 [Rhizobium sp. Root1220]
MSVQSKKTLKAMTTSEIVVFPVASRAGDIARCAAALDSCHGEEAVRFWKAECRKLADQLTSLGLSESEVRQQVLTFQAEVQGELVRSHQARAISESRNGRAIKR